jgi:hypothetical protein
MPAILSAPVPADDEDEDVVTPDAAPHGVDTATRAALIRAAREYWDKKIEQRSVPRATDIAKEVGIPVDTARAYRALWKLEPKAHALVEAAFREHGILDTGNLPVIPAPEEPVLTVNGSSVS